MPHQRRKSPTVLWSVVMPHCYDRGTDRGLQSSRLGLEYQVLEMLVQVQGLPELLSEFKTSLGSLWKLCLKMKTWKESWGYGSVVRDLFGYSIAKWKTESSVLLITGEAQPTSTHTGGTWPMRWDNILTVPFIFFYRWWHSLLGPITNIKCQQSQAKLAHYTHLLT